MLHATLRLMQALPAVSAAEFPTEVRKLRKLAGMSQKEASEALSVGDISVSERAISDYERGKGAPPNPKRAAILRRLRTLADEAAGSPGERVDYRSPGHVPDLGFIDGASVAPSAHAGLATVGSQVISEWHDEAGIAFAVRVVFLARESTRRLGFSSRVEPVTDAPDSTPEPPGAPASPSVPDALDS